MRIADPEAGRPAAAARRGVSHRYRFLKRLQEDAVAGQRLGRCRGGVDGGGESRPLADVLRLYSGQRVRGLAGRVSRGRHSLQAYTSLHAIGEGVCMHDWAIVCTAVHGRRVARVPHLCWSVL